MLTDKEKMAALLEEDDDLLEDELAMSETDESDEESFEEEPESGDELEAVIQVEGNEDRNMNFTDGEDDKEDENF